MDWKCEKRFGIYTHYLHAFSKHTIIRVRIVWVHSSFFSNALGMFLSDFFRSLYSFLYFDCSFVNKKKKWIQQAAKRKKCRPNVTHTSTHMRKKYGEKRIAHRVGDDWRRCLLFASWICVMWLWYYVVCTYEFLSLFSLSRVLCFVLHISIAI